MLSLLATGGTIACTPGPDGLEPTLRAADLLACLGSALPCRVRPQDVFLLDSSNVQPEEWCALARAVREALDASDGVVITHGTDTMAYTAAALSFLLAGVQKPVILTGSQLPPGHPLSDARLNLLRAIAAAQAGVAGVYVCFGDRLISGVRCVKTHTTAMDAFSSVNAPLAGRFDVEGVRFDHPQPFTPPPGADLTGLRLAVDPRVFLLKLVPGTSPDVLDFVGRAGYRGLVIEARPGRPALHPPQPRGPLLPGPQRRSGPGREPVPLREGGPGSTRSPSGLAGIRPGRDMTTEAAVCKLMWAPAQTTRTCGWSTASWGIPLARVEKLGWRRSFPPGLRQALSPPFGGLGAGRRVAALSKANPPRMSLGSDFIRRTEGSVCPVARRKRQPAGLLPPKVAKRP